MPTQLKSIEKISGLSHLPLLYLKPVWNTLFICGYGTALNIRLTDHSLEVKKVPPLFMHVFN